MTHTQKPVVVKLSTPPNIVGAIPSFIGFHPEESLVVICLRGPRKRNGLIMRTDLPRKDDTRPYAGEIAKRAAADGADGVILVIYTAAADHDGDLPRRDLVVALLEELDSRDIGYTELLLVRDGKWSSYTCAQECCPPEGTPLPATPSSELLELEAQRALQGRAVLPSRTALADTVRGPRSLRLVALEQRYEVAGPAFGDEVRRTGAATARSGTLELARSCLEQYADSGDLAGDDDAVRILVGLEDKLARDALITWGLDDRFEVVVAFLSGLARCALDENAAPICTVVAAVAYQNGDGALAAVALERALHNDPGYEMARMLDTLLQNQVDPSRIREMAQQVKGELRELGIAGGGRPEAA